MSAPSSGFGVNVTCANCNNTRVLGSWDYTNSVGYCQVCVNYWIANGGTGRPADAMGAIPDSNTINPSENLIGEALT